MRCNFNKYSLFFIVKEWFRLNEYKLVLNVYIKEKKNDPRCQVKEQELWIEYFYKKILDDNKKQKKKNTNDW